MIQFSIKLVGILITITMMSIAIRISTLQSTAEQITILLKTGYTLFQLMPARTRVVILSQILAMELQS